MTSPTDLYFIVVVLAGWTYIATYYCFKFYTSLKTASKELEEVYTDLETATQMAHAGMSAVKALLGSPELYEQQRANLKLVREMSEQFKKAVKP